MSVTSILDNMISVTDLNRGGASKTLSRVGNNHPVIVLDGNRPSAVIITPDDYWRLTQAEEDFALYQEAMDRLHNGDGTQLTDIDYSASITIPSTTVLNQNLNKACNNASFDKIFRQHKENTCGWK